MLREKGQKSKNFLGLAGPFGWHILRPSPNRRTETMTLRIVRVDHASAATGLRAELANRHPHETTIVVQQGAGLAASFSLPWPQVKVALHGPAYVQYESLSARLGAGVCYLMDANSPLSITATVGTACTLVSIVPSAELLERTRLPDEPSHDAPVLFDLAHHGDEVTTLAERLAVRVTTPGSPVPVAADVEALVGAAIHAQRGLADALARCPGRSLQHRRTLLARLQRVRAVLDMEFTGSLKLDQMARLANLSKLHFLRVFQHVFGASPFKYFDAARIRIAQKLLLEQRGSVREVARMLGFIDRTAFARWFHAHAGITPVSVRRAGGARHGVSTTRRQRQLKASATLKHELRPLRAGTHS